VSRPGASRGDHGIVRFTKGDITLGSIGDITKVSVRYELLGQSCESVFGFKQLAGGVGMADLLSDMHTATIGGQTWVQTWLAHWPANVLFVELFAEDVVPGTQASIAFSVNTTGSAGTGDMLPPQNAAVTTLRTALKGRSYRGRCFISGIGEAGQTNGVLGAGWLGTQNTLLNWLLTRYGPSRTNTNFMWGVISRYLNKVKRVTPVLTEITSLDSDSIIRTQRRRSVGRGI
jgi:hypothetical protein